MLEAYGRWRSEPNPENSRLFRAACTLYRDMDPNFDEGAWPSAPVHWVKRKRAALVGWGDGRRYGKRCAGYFGAPLPI